MTPQPPRFNPDNSQEVRAMRMDHYNTVASPDTVEEALQAELGRGYRDPVVHECRKELRLILGGAAIDLHDPIIDDLPASNLIRFPVERTRPPEPEAA